VLCSPPPQTRGIQVTEAPFRSCTNANVASTSPPPRERAVDNVATEAIQTIEQLRVENLRLREENVGMRESAVGACAWVGKQAPASARSVSPGRGVGAATSPASGAVCGSSPRLLGRLAAATTPGTPGAGLKTSGPLGFSRSCATTGDLSAYSGCPEVTGASTPATSRPGLGPTPSLSTMPLAAGRLRRVPGSTAPPQRSTWMAPS
jgi:hypothetical protein